MSPDPECLTTVRNGLLLLPHRLVAGRAVERTTCGRRPSAGATASDNSYIGTSDEGVAWRG